MTTKTTVSILTYLDCFLDTRLGTLHRISPKTAEDALEAGYHEREEDAFPGVGREEFRKLYSERDVDTLMVSHPTEGLSKLIAEMAEEMAQQVISRPYYDEVRLCVNVHPYVLTEEEREQIRLAVSAWIGSAIPVDIVNMPIESITPELCKQSFGAMFMYEAETWLNHHMRALEKVQIPDVLLLVPALYHQKKPTDDELKEAIRMAANPFQGMEWMAAPLVELKFISVDNVCLVKRPA